MIQHKMIFSMILLLFLGLFINIAVSSAANVNQSLNISSNVNSSAMIVSSNAVSNNVSSNTINQTIKSASSNATAKVVIVNGLTVTMLKDGLSRVQAFYKKNGRLPNYVNYGTRQISISTFEKNLITAGLTLHVSPNPSSVSSLASSLAIGSTSKYETAVRLFDWVRDHLGYTFYYGTKYGAAGTLKAMTGNCCDTSNLIVALARDDGISARYIHGYCQFKSGTWYDHVWAQLYVNGKWYNADGISYDNTLGVITNWNTATYKLEGIYSTLPF
ncbi:MAG: transglutaminase domain-containing protein [Methanobacterium sp.]|uniref:transglutaminase domain-containing protein n=1 Tax=Methanobacterium sp. TaxID=2164 RepID=UPI003C77BA99